MSNPKVQRANDESKDQFFAALANLSEKMIAIHGKDFAMGALVLAARFIAEGKTSKAGEAKPN